MKELNIQFLSVYIDIYFYMKCGNNIININNNVIVIDNSILYSNFDSSSHPMPINIPYVKKLISITLNSMTTSKNKIYRQDLFLDLADICFLKRNSL